MVLRRCRLTAALAVWSAAATAQDARQPGQPKEPLSASNYRYVTAVQRLRWYVRSTAGFESALVAAPVSAAWSTWRNKPAEYGPHWEGFGRRYRIRMASIATENALEALGGAALGEDPRYVPAAPGTPFGGRMKRIFRSTFTAYRPDGSQRFSYTRAAALVGGNVLSNTWRVDSDATAGRTALRCVWGVTGRMAGNAFAEFMPDLWRAVRGN